jgi:gliding motility-associated-like protein
MIKRILFSLFISLSVLAQGQSVFTTDKNYYNHTGLPGACHCDDPTKLSAKPVHPNGNSTLGPIYDTTGCGINYVQKSVMTTTRYTACPCYYTPGTGFPTKVNITGLPSCAKIIKAYLWCEASCKTAPTSYVITDSVGNPLSANNTFSTTLVGTSISKCWGETGTGTWRADITSIISGNGIYTVDLNGFTEKDWEVDGVTILIVYKDPSSTYTGTIALADGEDVVDGGSLSYTLTGFNACAASSAPADSAFMVTADLQSNASPTWTATENSTIGTFKGDFYQCAAVNTTVSLSQTTATYSITDAGDCYAVFVAGLYFQTPCLTCIPASSFTLSPSSSATICTSNTGTASVTVSGGTLPYTYNWSNGATTSSISGLAAGTYTVIVKDASGCGVDTSTVLVKSSDSLAAVALNAGNVKCNGGNNGIATVSTSGGSSPFTYTWSNGATTDTINNLSAGTYTVTTTDKNGCTFTSSVTVSQPPVLTISVDSTKGTTCYGDSNGRGNVHATGGQAPYSYSWSPSGNTGSKVTNLKAGSYTVTVTDTNGCTATASLSITQPARISPIVTGKDSLCLGSFTTLTISASGTTTYSWSPTTGVSCPTCATTNVSPATTTTYTVTASNGVCSGDTTVTVKVIPLPVPTVTAKPDSICIGDSAELIAGGGTSYVWTLSGQTSDSIWVAPTTTKVYDLQVTKDGCTVTTTKQVVVIGDTIPTISISKDSVCKGDSAVITAAGGKAYKWMPGGATTASITAKPGITTTYTCIITTACHQDTLTEKLNVIPYPVIGLSHDTTICNGGVVTLAATGGVTYSWSNGSTSSTITVAPTSTKTYTLAVSNGKCAKDTSVTVTVNNPATVSITPDQKVCAGTSVTLTATATGSTYLWSNGATTSSITVTPTSNTTYTVVVSNGCPTKDSTQVFVVTPALSACCDTTIITGDTVTINAYGDVSYIWSPSTSLSCSTCPDPVASPTVTTTYTVVSTDSNNCHTSREVTVFVECLDFTVPNIFTPNNDGRNDDFVPYYTVGGTIHNGVGNVSSYSIQIYDRWGKQVYNSTDPTKYWNGTLNNTQYLVPDGVYYYIIKATCGGNNFDHHGFVQVLAGGGK